MLTNQKLIKSLLLLGIIFCGFTNIEGGRRGSFGKRISKPSSKGSRASVKDTTSEPEPSAVTEGADMDLKCNGVEMKVPEDEIVKFKACGSSVGVTTKADLTLDKVPCFAKCIFEAKKLIDEKGIVHKENIPNMFYENMPDPTKEDLKTALGKCMDENSAPMNPTEDGCLSYSGIATCIHTIYNDICKINF